MEYFDNRMGICQWFHFEDHRLDYAVDLMKSLGVKELRTGLSWADRHRPNALEWFDRQMKKLKDFDVTLTLCFTPPSLGRRPCHTSPPVDPEEYARLSAEMVNRYVLGRCGNGGHRSKTPAVHDLRPTTSGSRMGRKEAL